MLIKILFWIIVLIDLGGVFLLFVLGLAAAPSSHASPLGVAAYLLIIPGMLLAGSIILFLRSNSALGRSAAFVLVASPMIALLLLRGLETAKLRFYSDSQGNLTYFRAGRMSDMAKAISNNDAATVASLAPQVNINERGYSGRTLLTSALRQLEQTPDRLEVLRILMKAGADPNVGKDEVPLETALQISAKTGPQPVLLLLAAGANPNARNSFGTPVYFASTGHGMSTDLLKTLLDHGADIKAKDNQGMNAVHQAALSPNWKAVLLLLQRGADWKQIRTPDGLTFKDMLDAHNRVYGDEGGLAEVIEYLQRQ